MNRLKGEPTAALTPREIEVARLVAVSQTNKQIAARFGISAETVKNHVSSIYRKLRLRDRVALADWVRRSVPPASAERAA